jgi:hypothetical protein
MVLAAKQPAVLPAHSQATQPPRLLDRVRKAIRARHDSPGTEEACVSRIRRFILFHNQRHPVEMGEPEITVRQELREGRGRDYLPDAVAKN